MRPIATHEYGPCSDWTFASPSPMGIVPIATHIALMSNKVPLLSQPPIEDRADRYR